jgi:hypothetical protein
VASVTNAIDGRMIDVPGRLSADRAVDVESLVSGIKTCFWSVCRFGLLASIQAREEDRPVTKADLKPQCPERHRVPQRLHGGNVVLVSVSRPP